MLDGKLWLPEIGHSTHYHAYWVHPSWVDEMRKLYKIGVHTLLPAARLGRRLGRAALNQSQSRTQSQADDVANKAKL